MFGKTEEQIDSLVDTVIICSGDIGMEFGLRKCGIPALKRGKVFRNDRIELPKGAAMREARKVGCTYLGIANVVKLKPNEIKAKIMMHVREGCMESF